MNSRAVSPAPDALALLAHAAASASPPADGALGEWLAGFLDTMLRLAQAEAGALRTLTPEGRQLRLVAAAGVPAEVLERERLMPADCGVCGQALARGTTCCEAAGAACAARSGAQWFEQFAGATVVPLAYKGRLLGVCSLFHRNAPAHAQQTALALRAVGEHIGMALENARLARENLRMTVMNERQLIAAEVHDSIAQTLAYMKTRVTLLREALRDGEIPKAMRYVAEVQAALGEAYSDLRELLAHFRTRMDPLGLAHALEKAVEEFRRRSGIALVYDNRLAEPNLSVDEEAHAFHILQEALANVARHSGARNARLVLEEEAGEYRFTLEDDGLGFFTLGGRPGRDEGRGLRHHLGVNIMRERARRLGGRIEIANLPGGGARVRLVMPADPARRAAEAAS